MKIRMNIVVVTLLVIVAGLAWLVIKNQMNPAKPLAAVSAPCD